MFRIALLVLFAAANAWSLDLSQPIVDVQQLMQKSDVGAYYLDWKEGDNADYKIDMGFLQGTMKMHVREVTPDITWIEQNASIAGQQQKVEIKFDNNSHQVLEIIVNGDPQDLPDSSNQEIIETREEEITVPAGTFPCFYVKIRDTAENKDSEAWINPDDIPMMGLIKQRQDSQFGPVNIDLVSFLKQ